MKPLRPLTRETLARRRPILFALAALALMMHTVTTTLRRSAPFRSAPQRQQSSTEMHVLEAHQRAVDEAALRLAVATNTTVAPDVLARLEARDRDRTCFDERDYGMIPILQSEYRTLCDNATGVDSALGNLSTYRYYNSEGAKIMSSLITNVWVDLRTTKVFKPITDASQEGHMHDPRFQHDTMQAYCVCNANQDESLGNGERVWGFIHGDHSWRDEDKWHYCTAIQRPAEIQALSSGFSSTPWNTSISTNTTAPDPRGWPYKVQYVERNAIIIARRDDHNPFFQIAVAMNAWIMMQVLEWSPESTQLVYFDDGIPAITDELQRRVLAPNHPVVTGRDVLGSVLHFDQAMVAPFEYMGPMMRRLDGHEPCHHNALIDDFRKLVMDKFGVSSEKRDIASCTITVITRRPYAGRMVQRKWLNEDTILERMRHDYANVYKYATCRFQSLEFADLTLDQQMRTIVESDVVIGMHGAGMVNVLWARPETYVAEIFPEHRHRWGYRNVCQYIGCSWSQFRGGRDTGTGDNGSDKAISYADWFGYFDPIIREAVTALEARVAESTWR